MEGDIVCTPSDSCDVGAGGFDAIVAEVLAWIVVRRNPVHAALAACTRAQDAVVDYEGMRDEGVKGWSGHGEHATNKVEVTAQC